MKIHLKRRGLPVARQKLNLPTNDIVVLFSSAIKDAAIAQLFDVSTTTINRLRKEWKSGTLEVTPTTLHIDAQGRVQKYVLAETLTP
jgi:hypothetical protein